MKIINGQEFINDEDVIGKWINIGWTSNSNNYTIEGIQPKDGEYNELYFLPEGEGYWIFEGWSKGVLFIHYGGNSPVLSYFYQTRQINKQEYLFLSQDDRLEIFKAVDHNRYLKDTLGRHDIIDLPFVYDNRILGKWKSCGFVSQIKDFKEEIKQYDLCLSEIEFFKDGQLIQQYMDDLWQDHWTNGLVLSTHRKTASRYSIKTVNQNEYLFVEWKMGNYIYGGFEAEYYVFEKMK